MSEIFDPFRFDRVEIQSAEDQIMLDRLSARINEFKDLAETKDWESIKNNRDVCLRLQQAHNIMHDYYYPPEFLKQHRCCPCEMEGLCAIKTIVNGSEFRKEHSKEVWRYFGWKLDSEKIRKNIENKFTPK